MKKIYLTITTILISILSYSTGLFQTSVKVPYFFGDNMVLQRQKPIRIWGTSFPKKSFEIEFAGERRKVKADASGTWKTEFSAKEAGGPFEMKFLSDSAFTLKNILIGDVYLCSGQSNMELRVFQAFNSAYELRSADFPDIRYFAMPKKRSLQALSNTLPAQWKITTPNNAATYSAVAWFFAKNIHEWEKIPIGLIDNSWGGTPIEYWTSLESLAIHPDYKEKANLLLSMRNPAPPIKATKKQPVTEEIRPQAREIVSDKGLEEKWYSPDYKPVDWMSFIAPGYWENQGLKDYDGVVWMRKEFNIPSQLAKKDLVVNLEIMDNFDKTYFNGVEIGSVYWAAGRRTYIVAANLVKPGKNLIAIRIENPGGNGGFEAKNAIDLRIQELVESDEPVIVPLSGHWLMKPVQVSHQNSNRPNQTVDYNSPSFIYNAMVAPLSNLSLKAILWYQGESNGYRAYQYRSLFPLMINDWRKQFQQGDLPFLFVQLAGHMALTENPVEHYWAETREAQTMALSLPNTGMVVTIDVGNPYDVHPTNKQEVGRRLALEAEKVVYGKTNIITSPVYKSMKTEGNRIRLSFSNSDNGLIAKNGPLKGFAIAGEDKKFVWAKAEVQGKEVVVWNDQIQVPVAVRYAWTGSPVESNGANLYNREDFPASPFRTDDWPGITVNNR
jgi:sialate O-acetylesterase